MTFVCLWSPGWSTAGAPLAELAALLLEEAPRVAVDGRGVLWADARGLPAERLARVLLERLDERAAAVDALERLEEEDTEASGGIIHSGYARADTLHSGTIHSGSGRGGPVYAGISNVPVAAELAARTAAGPTPERRIVLVRPGGERAFLASLPLTLLRPEARLQALLEGVGIRTCGQLAAIERAAVEVRFGAAGAALWRLVRTDDPRRLFHPIPRERPHASLDFIDYAVRDAGRLTFTANALLKSVCADLRARGERARRMTLRLALSNGETLERPLRLALPTAVRDPWLRRIRGVLGSLSLPDSVEGVGLSVEEAEAASGRQGDLFDRGFATEAAMEEAAARLVDAHGPLFVEPETCDHPLPERRTRWVPRDPADVARGEERSASGREAPGRKPSGRQAPGRREAPEREIPRETPGREASEPSAPQRTPSERKSSSPAGNPGGPPGGAELTLQLLPEPRRIRVRSWPRRDHLHPLELFDGATWQELAVAVGPHRISGGHWEGRSFAREYFQCVTPSGRLLWIYHDVREQAWYLQGWWD